MSSLPVQTDNFAMLNGSAAERLEQLHTEEAIADRLAKSHEHSYLGDFILGAVDGGVTTFAIVAGAAGAGLSNGIAIVLGLANVVADGFSMAAGNYLKVKADHQNVDRARRTEEMHIDKVPEGEREEIRQIFAAKGFDGSALEDIVSVITNNRQQWIDTMLTDEWGLQLQPPSPVRAALSTLTAFVLAGLIPLLPLFFAIDGPVEDLFPVAAGLTGVTFYGVGWMRGRIVDDRPLLAGLETLLIGGAAATLAYFVGYWLQALVGPHMG